MRAMPGRAVGADLLADRQVQPHVQEGILAAAFGGEFRAAARHRPDSSQPMYSGCSAITAASCALERFQRLARAELAPGFEVAAAHLLATLAGEQRPCSRRAAARAMRRRALALRLDARRLRLGLVLVLAQVADQAGRAGRRARGAHVAPVQQQPVVRVLAVLRAGCCVMSACSTARGVLARVRARCGWRRGRCACRPRSRPRRTPC